MMLALAALGLVLSNPPAQEPPPLDLTELQQTLQEQLIESIERDMRDWSPPGYEIILGPRITEPPSIDIDLSEYEIVLEDLLALQTFEVTQTVSTPDHAAWTMFWDNTVDGSVPGRDYSCVIDLHIRNGIMSGAFVGPVLGQLREACFTGTSLQIGSGAVFNFQQDEPGYRCVYAGRLTGEGHIAGTWYDTNGGDGDFVMFRDGTPPQRDLTND